MRKKFSVLVLLAGWAFVAPLQAFAQQAPTTAPSPPEWYWRPGPWHMWGDAYGGHFWWMPFLMMPFILLVFGAVIYFLFARGHHWGPMGHRMDRMWSPPTYSALQILNERLARGEIQKDEYEEKKAIILAAGPS